MRELYMNITKNKQRTTTITLTHRAKEIFGIAVAAFAWGMFTAWLLCGMPV